MSGSGVTRIGSYSQQLLVIAGALATLVAATGCGGGPTLASAAERAPAPIAHHGVAAFAPGPDPEGATGDVGLGSVLLGLPATFRVQIQAHTTCKGWVVFSGRPTSEWITLDSISTGSAGELSWTWDTPADASPGGGYVAIVCGAATVHIPFAIGAPEIGRLASH